MTGRQKLMLWALIPALGTPLALLLDRTPPFRLEGGRSIPTELTAGQPYRFSWLLIPERPRQCEGLVYLRITDFQGITWSTPVDVSQFAPVETPIARPIVGRERILPSAIASGAAVFNFRIQFECNFMHRFWPITVDYPPVPALIR